MKRYLSLLLTLTLVLTGMSFTNRASAASLDISYEGVPAQYRAKFKAEVAYAIANARARAPGQSALSAQTRGTSSLIEGYRGTKSDNSLTVTHIVPASVVKAGEKVSFTAYMGCTYAPVDYAVVGIIYDTNFNPIEDIKDVDEVDANGNVKYGYDADGNKIIIGDGIPDWRQKDDNNDGVPDWQQKDTDKDGIPDVEETSRGVSRSKVISKAAYVNWVFLCWDGVGNCVAVSTNTVQVYEGDEPPLFENVGVDMNTDMDAETEGDQHLSVSLALDRKTLKVGDTIRATAEISTTCDPVNYRGVWTLEDDEGNVLDRQDSGLVEINAQANVQYIPFDYQPLQAGKLQFRIVADDGGGQHIENNTPILNVEDGFYFTAWLNRVSPLEVTATSSLTAKYEIHGHECAGVGYYTGWRCVTYEGSEEKTLVRKTATVEDRTGQSTYSPRQGTGVVFYVGATCEHFPGAAPATQRLPLINGLLGDVSLTADTVAFGDTIGVTYEFDGGVTPYQVEVTGYSYDSEKGKTYTFVNKTLTRAVGTVTGSPKLGDQVYFVVKLVEADGHTTTWETGRADLTGTTVITEPFWEAISVSPTTLPPGETVTLNYHMRGGSGTLDKSGEGESYVQWKKANGSVVARENLTAVKGAVSFTPTEAGKYTCEVLVTDAYLQQLSWTSETISVEARLPGDADGNAVVNIYDALRVMQYAARWNGVSVDKSNADVDGSNSVTIADAVLILRWCAGEAVELQ